MKIWCGRNSIWQEEGIYLFYYLLTSLLCYLIISLLDLGSLFCLLIIYFCFSLYHLLNTMSNFVVNLLEDVRVIFSLLTNWYTCYIYFLISEHFNIGHFAPAEKQTQIKGIKCGCPGRGGKVDPSLPLWAVYFSEEPVSTWQPQIRYDWPR